jgi:hypothetical protein
MTGIIAFAVIVLVILGALVALSPIKGCSGDCRQGRDTCDCRGGDNV